MNKELRANGLPFARNRAFQLGSSMLSDNSIRVKNSHFVATKIGKTFEKDRDLLDLLGIFTDIH